MASEKQAASQYQQNWGFLQPHRGDDTLLEGKSDQELDHMIASTGPCYKFIQDQAKRRTMSSTGAAIMGTSRPGSGKVSVPGSKADRLDARTALALQPQMIQGVGASIATPGVDPQLKYKHPQTAQHVVGWQRHNLEFFGVAQHGRRAHAQKAQYDEE